MDLQMFLCKFVQMQMLHALIINPYFYVGLIIILIYNTIRLWQVPVLNFFQG